MKKGNEYLTKRELDEAVEYYHANAFGFSCVEHFVATEYAFFGLSDKAFKDAVKYIREHV